MHRQYRFLFGFLFGLFVISACAPSNEFSDLHDRLAEIAAKPKGRIPPPPEFKAFKTYTYQVAGQRSPFDPPVKVVYETKIRVGKSVKPDLSRRAEPLEAYSLDSMAFVGTLEKELGSEPLWAIVDDGEGNVHRVKEGYYLGKNHGLILGITERRIEVVEIVPNGQLDDDGNKMWIERPRSLVLRDE